MPLPPDIPTLTALWFAAFQDPDLTRLWPNTPSIRQWFVDINSLDAQENPRIAAYAKWDLSTPEQRGERYPPWHSDIPGEECGAFFGREERERGRVMGDTKHYYLDTLATHPDYQRQGAGSMLLKWGCDLADEQGVGLYVDASKAGAPLYERFGFVDESEPGAGEVASMVRSVASGVR
ncbi:hypothetical protein BDV12DRAFT_194577 [Aspergillus spectabilis]